MATGCGGAGAEASGRIEFDTLLHADWSASAPGRWVARADRTGAGWHVTMPRPVGDLPEFVDGLSAEAGSVLAGFDLPFGLPAWYGAATGLHDFRQALDRFGTGEWADIYAVADRPEEVAIRRPFYPRSARDRPRLRHLLDAHGVAEIAALRRRCEAATADRRGASPLFWTLGANQVGKAAICGWREVAVPLLRRGASLWPFDGTLATLARRRGVVLAETYPAEAYAHVGLRFGPKRSKRRDDDRREVLRGLPDRLDVAAIAIDPATATAIRTGFAGHKRGDDAFDALVGLLGMIEVVAGRRAEGPEPDAAMRRWEGWILGLTG